MRLPSAEERPLLAPAEIVHLFPGRGRSGVYAAIAAGELPVLRSGRRVWIVTARLREQLGLDPTNSEAGPATGPALALVPPATTAEEGQHHYAPDPPAA